MLFDLKEADSDPYSGKTFDVCICGAGVAGITLALKLARRLSVLLLEGGDLEVTPESTNIYRGSIAGREYFDLTATRQRFFGGTSNHWGGMCRPLDAVDFESKPWSPVSGWPINKRDLDPYVEEARSILDIIPEKQSPAGMTDALWREAAGKSADFRSIGWMWSKPTRFAEKYGEAIRQAKICIVF